MLRVIVELLPGGDESCPEQLGVIDIWREHSDPLPVSTYTAALKLQGLRDGKGVHVVNELGHLRSNGVWVLLRRVLERLTDPLAPQVIDAEHLERQRAFSERTFGPGRRTEGISEHIRKELAEVAEDPDDYREWVDIAILALDGAWRTGVEPQMIIDQMIRKQEINEGRDWPDWRDTEPGSAIEHVRTYALCPESETGQHRGRGDTCVSCGSRK